MLGQIDLLVNSFVRGVDALERIAGALEKTAEIQDRTIMNFSEALTHNSDPDAQELVSSSVAEVKIVGESGPELQATTSEDAKRNRPTKEEMTALRNKAIAAVEASGLDMGDIEAQLKANSDKWSTRQCEKALELAAAANPVAGTPELPTEEEGPAHSAATTPPAEEVITQPDQCSITVALSAFIRAQATGKPLTLNDAEELIKNVTENKPPKIEVARAYLASCVNNGVLTKDRAMELIRLRGIQPGMTPEQIAKVTLPVMDPCLWIAVVHDIAREGGVQ